MEIKEYLQELLDKWNKYDELDGFTADSFRNDLEKLLEYWDLRIKEEPVRIFYAGDMCVGSSNKPKKQPEKQEDWRDRIQSFSLGVSESFKIDGEYIDSKEELVAFISQLLSERTFNQKELGILDNIGEELFLRGYEYSDEEIEVLQKLSKLLNNNNEKDRKANTHKHR